MFYYFFKLELRRIVRVFRSIGISVGTGLFLLLLLFALVSFALLREASLFNQMIYALFGLSVVSALDDKEYAQFFELLTTKKSIYWKAIMLKNASVATPFLTLLLWDSGYAAAGGLFVAVLSFPFLRRATPSFVLPLPSRWLSFEFIAGFRQYWGVIFLVYLLFARGLVAENVGFALFFLGVLPLFCTALFYGEPEDEFFLWSYDKSPSQFLVHKMQYCLLGIFTLIFPMVLALVPYFTSQTLAIGIVLLVSFTVSCFLVVAKYRAYPFKLSIVDSVYIFIIIVFPPFMLFAFPYYFSNAKSNLKMYLSSC